MVKCKDMNKKYPTESLVNMYDLENTKGEWNIQ